ncbi:MAG: IclR family transcriptional regulator [Leptolinea sp.]|jgi:IclR family acetate operon transcriptional repressor|nr:IclR family transcriptional regulator [Leptolinea sp.]
MDPSAASLNNSVEKAFVILEFLANKADPIELSALSRALSINKSTAYRYLTTLESLGYVVKDADTSCYTLGSKALWLASKFLNNLDLRTQAHPILRKLSDETGETVHLAYLDNFEVVYVDKIDGKSPVKMASRIGNRMPAHCTGLGKALMAFLPETEWQKYIDRVGLKYHTRNTITQPKEFFDHLRMIRERGYSIDNSENEEGIRCVALPVRNHEGKVIAAISIAGWVISMTPDRDETLARIGQKYSQLISEKLGLTRTNS